MLSKNTPTYCLHIHTHTYSYIWFILNRSKNTVFGSRQDISVDKINKRKKDKVYDDQDIAVILPIIIIYDLANRPIYILV